MFTADHLQNLQERLEDAHLALRERRLDEQQAWRLLSDTEAALRDAQGSVFEGTVAVILDLVRTIWRVTHCRDSAIRRIRSTGYDASSCADSSPPPSPPA